MFKLLISLLFTVSFSVNSEINVIYGDDNRIEPYEASAKWETISLSTAAMIEPSKLKLVDNGYKIVSSNMGSYLSACSDERFIDQPTAAMCSGFLIKDDVLVTAGHCIKTLNDCNSYKWVFDYRIDNEIIPTNSVYGCKEIIKTVLSRNDSNDFAIIKLDRKVVDRSPLQIRESGIVSIGDGMTVIGHPTGLPTKIAGGANVRSIKGTYFIANLDTYGGNSGSAVFNDEGIVEGILVRGETDYVSRNGCRISNRISNNGGRGEEVTKITNLVQYLK